MGRPEPDRITVGADWLDQLLFLLVPGHKSIYLDDAGVSRLIADLERVREDLRSWVGERS